MTEHKLQTEFWVGDVVYLRVADEPMRGMVTSVNIRQAMVTFEVTWGTTAASWHHAMELSLEYVPDFMDREADARQK